MHQASCWGLSYVACVRQLESRASPSAQAVVSGAHYSFLGKNRTGSWPRKCREQWRHRMKVGIELELESRCDGPRWGTRSSHHTLLTVPDQTRTAEGRGGLRKSIQSSSSLGSRDTGLGSGPRFSSATVTWRNLRPVIQPLEISSVPNMNRI